ncbi:MAG: acetyl-coenzyme A synthetase N-terminal domain-containing protein, partial [Candidatus Korarchaeota archaeon]|nr:acetyl-coenzyme A synthetase N-terminal domain-containing protein [Candidatus Korarchaeota archaeon]
MEGPLPTESRIWPRRYEEVYERSMRDPEGFWAEQAKRLDWFKTWDRVLE